LQRRILESETGLLELHFGTIVPMASTESAIPPSREATSEALKLSEEILRNLELNEIPLTNVALKTSRLARLLNDLDAEKIMRLEASGYSLEKNGMTPENWRLAVAAGRKFIWNDGTERCFTESIDALEVQIRADEATLGAATAAASAARTVPNPNRFALDDKQVEGYRAQNARTSLHLNTERFASRRSLIYGYTVARYHELRFSAIASDVFARVRERADAKLATVLPDAVRRFTAVYDNLRSENPEDWSNAVHSCRRILQDLADAIFPPREEERRVESGGKEQRIKLGREQYINRIMAFIQDHSSSGRFEDIVGSQLSFIGERLDAVFRAAQKGSHDTILNREEADRFVVYTYLIVSDVLSLL